ncbi:hypothetical protein ACMX25_03375 [Caballeronia sp. 15715]|uniref:hypothetical protein n=1 Tax=Caballeronia sp. 15715 TaxID=3391030 RepID=UPI0039E41935
MSPKLALSALVGALSLSACYVVPYGSYGYYPAYPTYPGTPVVSTAQTQQEIPVEPAGAPGTGYVQQNYQGADNTPASAYASTMQPPQQYAAAPPVVYAPYPAYYPSYPVYAPYPAYPAYYGGYGYPAYGYGSSLSIGFGWGGGGRGHYYRR